MPMWEDKEVGPFKPGDWIIQTGAIENGVYLVIPAPEFKARYQKKGYRALAMHLGDGKKIYAKARKFRIAEDWEVAACVAQRIEAK